MTAALERGVSAARRSTAGPIKTEVLELYKLAWPIVMTNFLGMSMGVVDLMFVGPQGPDKLAAAALANTWQWATFLSSQGATSALETLCSQAYGAKQYMLVGIWLQRGLVVGTAFSIPVYVCWLLTERALIAIGQDPATAKLAGQFVYAQLFSLLPFMYFFLMQKYLQAQGNVRPAMVVGIIANLLNLALNFLLVRGLGSWPGLGFTGSSLATTISRWLQFGLLLGYILVMGLHRSTWPGWQPRAALSAAGLWTAFKLALPASAMICLEAWGFETASLMAGLLGQISLDAHAITLQLAALFFMYCLGVSGAGSTRIGNFLGAGDAARARRSARVCVTVACAGMAVEALFVLSTRHYLAYAYTREHEVVDRVAAMLPIMAAFQIFDGMQCSQGGVLRGIGRPTVGAVANLIGFSGVGLTCAYTFAFKVGWGLRGIWIGLACGTVVVALVQSLFLLRIDWQREALLARERSEAPGEEMHSPLLDADEEAALEAAERPPARAAHAHAHGRLTPEPEGGEGPGGEGEVARGPAEPFATAVHAVHGKHAHRPRLAESARAANGSFSKLRAFFSSGSPGKAPYRALPPEEDADPDAPA
eukprot:tig00020537_g10271.t1